MSHAAMGLIDRFISLAMCMLGIALSLTPLALWVAWSGEVLVIVVAVAAGSSVLLALLSEFENPGVEGRHVRDGRTTREVFTDESIAEVHRLFPLTYHHSLNETARFRRAMRKVRHLITGPATLGR